jgi:hypothetical protein
MIVSASYKTDIPAFYGEWFMNRLDAGYCKVRNPYGGKASAVSLARQDVDGFVFWTKNLGPFVDNLATVHEREYPFVVQYTINRYSRVLEPAVVSANTAIEHMKSLTALYGPQVAVWRYDTIVCTSETPLDFHVENFRQLAQSLRGTTNEVVISFAQIYKKTLKNLDLAAQQFGFTWTDPSDAEKRGVVKELYRAAKGNGMQLTLCSQPELLEAGAQAARCVDAMRFTRMSGQTIQAKLKGNREGCGCYASKDIGDYDTCPHGCVYCYAVRNRKAAQERYRQHDPTGEFLYQPGNSTTPSTPG